MAKCIPIIKRIQSSLISLQEKFPEANRFPHTTLNNINMEDNAPVPGSNLVTAFITNYTNNAFTKLQKYYTLIDVLVWYIVGLILNPAVKQGYFEY